MSADIVDQIARLQGDERVLVETIIRRIDSARNTYGAWRVGDGRNNSHEALCEVFDALAYVAAELVRISQDRRDVHAMSTVEELDACEKEGSRGVEL